MQTKVTLGRAALLLCLCPLPQASWASEHDEHHHHQSEEHHSHYEEHQAHEHGAGLLTLVQDRELVQLSLELDTHSLWGFEHAPANEAERARVERALGELEGGHSLFLLSDEAQCRADGVALNRPEGLDNPEHHGHMELEVHWRWRCDNPSALTGVSVGLFERFPELRSLRVQRLTDLGSGGGQLDRQHATLNW